MWDLSYSVPSLLLLVLYLGYYYLLPHIPTRKNNTFLVLLGIESATIIVDILSSWADMHYMEYPMWVLHLGNAVYYVLFFVRSYAFFAFTASALRLDPYINKLRTFAIIFPMLIGVVLSVTSPWTGLIYIMTDTGYHRGSAHFLTYIFAWFYIVLSYYALVAYKGNLRRRREGTSVFFYNTAILVGTFLRMAFPSYLLMDTFCLVAIVIIYLSFENPDFYLEARTRIFNSRALREYLEEVGNRKNPNMFAVVIRNYKEVREIYGAPQMDMGVGLMGDYFKKEYPRLKVFYYRSGRFILLGNEKINCDEMRRDISERFKSPWKASDTELFVDVGFAYIEPGNTVRASDVLLNVIAEALQEVGSTDGNDFIRIDEKIFADNEKETDVKRSLEYAIDHELVEVFLQPIYESSTRKIVGAEALSRIRDPQGSIIPPGIFIPIAEKNGRVNELGEQVFEKVCAFMQANDLNKLGLSWINVNLSPIQLMRNDLADKLSAIIKQYDVDPGRLHLEITEETMVDEVLLLKQIETLQNSGFYFALDDYGKGYSNLSRLKRCPFINIKIDMSLVWEYNREPDDMLPNMVKTFKNMGFSITSEGIEDEKMADEMTKIGCDYLQGYYFSRPIPMEEFVEKYS